MPTSSFVSFTIGLPAAFCCMLVFSLVSLVAHIPEEALFVASCVTCHFQGEPSYGLFNSTFCELEQWCYGFSLEMTSRASILCLSTVANSCAACEFVLWFSLSLHPGVGQLVCFEEIVIEG